jgi:hypothetical protein
MTMKGTDEWNSDRTVEEPDRQIVMGVEHVQPPVEHRLCKVGRIAHEGDL